MPKLGNDLNVAGNKVLNAVNLVTKKEVVKYGVIAVLVAILLGGLIYVGIRYRSE